MQSASAASSATGQGTHTHTHASTRSGSQAQTQTHVQRTTPRTHANGHTNGVQYSSAEHGDIQGWHHSIVSAGEQATARTQRATGTATNAPFQTVTGQTLQSSDFVGASVSASASSPPLGAVPVSAVVGAVTVPLFAAPQITAQTQVYPTISALPTIQTQTHAHTHGLGQNAPMSIHAVSSDRETTTTTSADSVSHPFAVDSSG